MRAAYVVLLTATPHNGDPRAFVSLCGIGALGDPLLVFRRTKAQVHLGAGRRVHRLGVRTSAAESRMHALLARFTRAVTAEHAFGDACLALSVLHKRAFSSPRSLELTVRRRLDTLGAEVVDGVRQLSLPLGDLRGEIDDSDEPPDCLAALTLADPRRERVLLGALRDAAHAAADDVEGETANRETANRESKLSALRRLLRRVAEPVVVFTEFRDTLLHLRAALRQPVLVLHGGLTRDERAAALADFANGRCRILLTTDAAGEGLNLHHRCRLIINLELPWNPMRLEQRIGRVDRIGQVRTVHAIHLIARDAGEGRVLDRLKARIARAQEDIAAANPIEDEERVIARSVIDQKDAEPALHRSIPAAAIPTAGVDEKNPVSGSERLVIDLRGEACSEVARLVSSRTLCSDAATRARAALDTSGPWLARARLRRTRLQLGHRAIALFRIDHEDGLGRFFDWTLVPVSLAFTARKPPGPEQWRSWWQTVGPDLRLAAEDAARQSCALEGDPGKALLSVRLARERRMAQGITGVVRPALQPGLFDRRTERIHLAEDAAAREFTKEVASRLRVLERSGNISARAARLLLVLVP